MDTFPYDSLDHALEVAGGYATWGAEAGTNTLSVILALIGIAISIGAAVMVTTREGKLLDAAADRLADKYN